MTHDSIQTWKLANFEMSRHVGEPAPDQHEVDVCAPEVGGGDSDEPTPATFAIDMYGLGHLLYWLLVGKRAYQWRRHHLCRQNSIKVAALDNSTGAGDVLTGLLEKDPEERMDLYRFTVRFTCSFCRPSLSRKLC